MHIPRKPILVLAATICLAACDRGLPSVSDTRPSQDDRILQDAGSMSDGSARLPHVTGTLVTSIEISSSGGVGGTTIAQDGTIYTANFNSSIWRTEPDGTTQLLTNEFVQASGNLALADGTLLQSDYNTNNIYLVQPDGQRRVFCGAGLDGPVGITQRSTGEYVVANHRGKFLAVVPQSGGDAELLIEDARMDQPNGVIVDAADNIYVADLGTGDVFRLSVDNELSVVASLPGQGNAHSAIANGALYVNKIWDHVIYRVELESGAYGIVTGNGYAGYEDGPTGTATIEEPNGIAAAPDGRSILFNTHRGTMGKDFPGKIILRELKLAN